MKYEIIKASLMEVLRYFYTGSPVTSPPANRSMNFLLPTAIKPKGIFAQPLVDIPKLEAM